VLLLQLIRRLDRDGSGQVSYQDFVDSLEQHKALDGTSSLGLEVRGKSGILLNNVTTAKPWDQIK